MQIETMYTYTCEALILKNTKISIQNLFKYIYDLSQYLNNCIRIHLHIEPCFHPVFQAGAPPHAPHLPGWTHPSPVECHRQKRRHFEIHHVAITKPRPGEKNQVVMICGLKKHQQKCRVEPNKKVVSKKNGRTIRHL